MLLICTRKKRISYKNSSKEYYRSISYMCLYTIAISLNITSRQKSNSETLHLRQELYISTCYINKTSNDKHKNESCYCVGCTYQVAN